MCRFDSVGEVKVFPKSPTFHQQSYTQEITQLLHSQYSIEVYKNRYPQFEVT